MKFIISENVREAPGVYKFTFSNGYFYIGSSYKILSRIKSHIAMLKYGRHGKKINEMFIICGDVFFEALEYTDNKDNLLIREDYFLRNLEDTTLCINNFKRIANIHETRVISATINKGVYYFIKSIAIGENRKISEVVSNLLQEAIDSRKRKMEFQQNG